jgi:hypothetical protein
LISRPDKETVRRTGSLRERAKDLNQQALDRRAFDGRWAQENYIAVVVGDDLARVNNRICGWSYFSGELSHESVEVLTIDESRQRSQ